MSEQQNNEQNDNDANNQPIIGQSNSEVLKKQIEQDMKMILRPFVNRDMNEQTKEEIKMVMEKYIDTFILGGEADDNEEIIR